MNLLTEKFSFLIFLTKQNRSFLLTLRTFTEFQVEIIHLSSQFSKTQNDRINTEANVISFAN